jgi:NAD(P)-dependent dehydrogenase (short-subunit alcohol dehydrogenase family)
MSQPLATEDPMARSTPQRVALVTGANRGIGFEISRQLASRGIAVIMAARDAGKGSAACDSLRRAGAEVFPQALDVEDEGSLRAAVAAVASDRGRIDILVNNAGIHIDDGADALGLPMDRFRRSLQTNTLGPLELCRLCIPIMRRQGYGRIVNIASTMGSLDEMGKPGSHSDSLKSPAYRLSKAALNAVTLVIAREVRGENILVNSCCPGWVRTDMGGDQAPLTPEQGADTPVWLATLPDGGPSAGFFRERSPILW